jgi:hypothetical protein
MYNGVYEQKSHAVIMSEKPQICLLLMLQASLQKRANCSSRGTALQFCSDKTLAFRSVKFAIRIHCEEAELNKSTKITTYRKKCMEYVKVMFLTDL